MNSADKTAALFAPEEFIALFGHGDKDHILTLDTLRYLGMMENTEKWPVKPMALRDTASGTILSY